MEATKVVPANSHADGAERVGGRLTGSARAGVERSDCREIWTVRRNPYNLGQIQLPSQSSRFPGKAASV